MKRGLFCVSIFILLAGLVGCGASRPVFQEGNHDREAGYEAAFKTRYASRQGLTVHVKNNMFQEEEAVALFDRIYGDYETIREKAEGAQGEVTVYIVENTLFGIPQAIENKVFCTPSDVEAGVYRECLTGACFRAESIWKRIGLAALFFDEGKNSEEEKEALREFYKQPERYSVLSMHPIYFTEAYAKDGLVQTARMTAYALTKYMTNEIGLEAFIKEGELTEYYRGWLEELGLEVSGELPDDRFQGIKCSRSDKYPVIMEYGNNTFCLQPVDWLQAADEVYCFFRDLTEGYEQLLNSIESEYPEVSLMLKDALNTPMWFYFQDSDVDLSHATEDMQVHLNKFEAVFHEMFHNVIPVLDWEYHWYYEGLVTFLTHKTYNYYLKEEKKEKFFQALTKGKIYEEVSEQDKKFFDCTAEIYESYTSLPDCASELDSFVWYQSIGRVKLLHPELTTELAAVSISVAERALRSKLDKDDPRLQGGNGLSYPEAMIYIEYLAKQYGLDTVVSVALGEETFSEAFHGDFETILARVIASLTDEGNYNTYDEDKE